MPARAFNPRVRGSAWDGPGACAGCRSALVQSGEQHELECLRARGSDGLRARRTRRRSCLGSNHDRYGGRVGQGRSGPRGAWRDRDAHQRSPRHQNGAGGDQRDRRFRRPERDTRHLHRRGLDARVLLHCPPRRRGQRRRPHQRGRLDALGRRHVRDRHREVRGAADSVAERRTLVSRHHGRSGEPADWHRPQLRLADVADPGRRRERRRGSAAAVRTTS